TADLVRVDVLRPQPPLSFVHPLVRGAVYEALTPIERTNGHARAADLLTASGAEPEEVAAHLLLVPPGRMPSDAGERVVAGARAAASSARSRGAVESAVAYLRRAPVGPAPRGRRGGGLPPRGPPQAPRDRRAGGRPPP